ncbi:MAG: phenylalanine--tRNA ligase subunit beta, partial [Oscillospiraceae bacterium]|nr:phenylalanine--tRNA ligase subunit beta [Oscillospiraceae bacterium]
KLNLSLKWLNDYIRADMPIEEFARGMTMSGSKVEKWTDLSEPLKNIVCGKVVSIEKHADSDKLWVAQVDTGKGNIVQIVTGAQNVVANALVPVVLEGGVVYNFHDGTVTEIKRGKLRGVESQGMMCSYNELGLTLEDLPYADEDGILLLDSDPESGRLKIGMDMLDFLGIRDIAVEFEITNNRPDCLSVIGLAREAGAAFDLDVNVKKPAFCGADGDLGLQVTVGNKRLCSRYMAAVVKNVKIAPSPRWLTERLRASGVRAINNIVDITNFVMLEYGHPMHAFDKRYVDGDEIIIRNAAEGEKITLLDGEERVLSADTLVIADAKKAIAVAGVMGGEFSGVMADTAEIVFESACFDGVSVRKTAQRIGRRTESSARFEKGIDPANAENALLRACELVELLGCGEVVKTIIDKDFSDHTPVRVKYDYKRINAILGSDISKEKQLEILGKLGFKHEDGFIIVPSIRTDVRLECDIAEEVARIYGYNEIGSAVPPLVPSGGMSAQEIFEKKTGMIMQGQGCHEMMTFSFISPKSYEKAGVENADSVVIRNPLGEETGVMRASVLPSMLEVIARNYNNRNPGGRFYEIGGVYLPTVGNALMRSASENGSASETPTDEQKALCIGLYGEQEDFLTLKGLVEELFAGVRVEAEFAPLCTNKSYHTGRCAEVRANGEVLGVIGEINPLVTDNYDIGTRVYCAELKMQKLLQHSSDNIRFKPLPKFPAMVRDLSLVCDESVTAGELGGIIQKNAKNLESISLFDTYSGSQIPEGKKSLSFKLIFRKAEATLTDEETDKTVSKILKALGEKSITLR